MKATLEDLVFALTKDMTASEMAKTALHIQIQQMITIPAWQKVGRKKTLPRKWV